MIFFFFFFDILVYATRQFLVLSLLKWKSGRFRTTSSNSIRLLQPKWLPQEIITKNMVLYFYHQQSIIDWWFICTSMWLINHAMHDMHSIPVILLQSNMWHRTLGCSTLWVCTLEKLTKMWSSSWCHGCYWGKEA